LVELAKVVGVAVVVAAVVAPSAGAKPKLRPISPAAAFVLPPPQRCVSKSGLTLRVRKVARVKWVGATVKIDGKRFRTFGRAALPGALKLSGLPSKRFAVSLTARAKDGRRATASTAYLPCPPLPGPPTPTPTPTPTPVGIGAPGSYSGRTPQQSVLSFYVSNDGTRLQDVTVPTYLGCTPTKTFYDHVGIADIAIGSDGSFAATTTQDGVLAGAPAHFTYTFSGHFQGTQVSGTYREDITYDNGIAFACTTNATAWTATRDAQGTQSAALPPGSYSGRTPEQSVFSFYVSNDGTHLQDVTVPTYLGCAPSKTFYDHIGIGDIAIAADGSFSGHATQDGVLAGNPAKYTYTFSGHAHGSTTAGVTRVAGTFREDIAYNDGTVRSCRTNDQAWYALRDAQGTQTLAAPSSGSYSGRTPEQSVFSFYVSNDGTHLQDVTVPTYLGCAPTKTFYDHIGIATIPLAADGSFSATTTQYGVLFGTAATFTYTFSGHVHGTDTSGTVRFAGTFRESIAYDDGVTHACTTDNQSWHASRDAQGTQTLPAPPAGSYSGRTPEQSVFSFYVSNDGTHLQDVMIPTYLGCAPAKTFYDHITIADIPLAADGSFSASATQDGILAGHAATFTYTFNGHLHGTVTGGAARFAGTYREDIAYDDGTSRSCTTDDQAWYATREAQGTQSASAPAGTYSGRTPEQSVFSFQVSNDGAHLLNVTVPTYLGCAPSKTFYDHITIADIPLAADGSFAATVPASGTLSGHPATFTYTLRGHVHGTTSTGVTRIAGTYREDIAYSDGVAYSCTTNDQAWYALQS
jgi:hypothetical protein